MSATSFTPLDPRSFLSASAFAIRQRLDKTELDKKKLERKPESYLDKAYAMALNTVRKAIVKIISQ